MKIILSFAFICLLSLSVFAQRSPDIKVGLGMPFVFGNETGSVNLHTIKPFPTVSIEKPFSIGSKQKKSFSINPGVAYHYFMEEDQKITETAKRDYQLYHHTLNGYGKFLFQTKLKSKTEAYFYLGPIAGVHLFTKTTGSKISYSENTKKSFVEIKVNENSRDFLGLFYYGAVAGFQPNVKIGNFIKPSFEAAYYPEFVTRRDEKAGMLQFSLFLGFQP